MAGAFVRRFLGVREFQMWWYIISTYALKIEWLTSCLGSLSRKPFKSKGFIDLLDGLKFVFSSLKQMVWRFGVIAENKAVGDALSPSPAASQGGEVEQAQRIYQFLNAIRIERYLWSLGCLNEWIVEFAVEVKLTAIFDLVTPQNDRILEAYDVTVLRILFVYVGARACYISQIQI